MKAAVNGAVYILFLTKSKKKEKKTVIHEHIVSNTISLIQKVTLQTVKLHSKTETCAPVHME